jgi:hypothetical protein
MKRSSARPWILVFPVLLLAAMPAQARDEPSFSSRYSSWHATDIVVVNAKGVVVEVWKGDLKPGDALPIADLAIPQKPAVAYGPGVEKKAGQPDNVSGDRMVLFLIGQKTPAGAMQWKPASLFGGMQVSVVWIEKTQAYAFVQLQNPGASEVRPLDPTPEDLEAALAGKKELHLGRTEADLKAEVRSIVDAQESMRKAAKTADAGERAKLMVPLLDSTVYGCAAEAFKTLAECKDAALPVLRDLLSQDERLAMHREILKTMAAAGGNKVLPDLLKVVEEELAYWKKEGPGHQHPWSSETMVNHYGRLSESLRLLSEMGVPKDKRAAIIELRDFWQSLPQLNDIGRGTGPGGVRVGVSPIVSAAEAILRQ